MKIHLIVSAVAALALQACSPPTDKAAAEAPATQAEAAASPIALEAAGLKIGTTTLALGATQEATVNAVTAAIGVAPTETDAFEECGAGPMQHVAWDNGLHLLFQSDAFAGWQATTPDLAAANGTKVGMTLAAFEAANPGATIEQDSIGWYFSAAGIDGYFDETKAFVQRLNVGVTCDAT